MTRRSAVSALLPATMFLRGQGPAVLDPDGMLRIGGTRTFLLGLYQLPRRPDAWKSAVQAGFHIVSAKPERAALDEARQHGMHAWVTVGSQEARIRSLVDALKHHPALLYWETEDEPSFVWNKARQLRVPPETIRKAYSLLKTLDPARPVYLNHAPTNLVSTLRRYNPGGDLIATDVYPVMPAGRLRPQYALWPDGQQGDLLDTSIAQVGRYAAKMRDVAGRTRGLFMVLQGFAWEMLRDAKDRDPNLVVYPTREQTRFMAYQAIVHGVTGLVWWGLHTTPPESGLWESIAAVAGELKQLAGPLASAALASGVSLEYHETGHSIDRGIEWTLRPSGAAEGAFLIAVNADKNPVDVSFGGLSRFRHAQALFEERAAGLRGGILRDDFEPFRARVYRLSV